MKIFALSVITAQLLACGVLGATFKVIAPGSTDVEVSVNGQRVKLTAKDPDIPYYIGDAPAKANAKYKVHKSNLWIYLKPIILLIIETKKIVHCRRKGRVVRPYLGRREYAQRLLWTPDNICGHSFSSKTYKGKCEQQQLLWNARDVLHCLHSFCVADMDSRWWTRCYLGYQLHSDYLHHWR